MAKKNVGLELPDANVAAELNELLKNTLDPQAEAKVGVKKTTSTGRNKSSLDDRG